MKKNLPIMREAEVQDYARRKNFKLKIEAKREMDGPAQLLQSPPFLDRMAVT